QPVLYAPSLHDALPISDVADEVLVEPAEGVGAVPDGGERLAREVAEAVAANLHEEGVGVEAAEGAGDERGVEGEAGGLALLDADLLAAERRAGQLVGRPLELLVGFLVGRQRLPLFEADEVVAELGRDDVGDVA